MIGWTLSGAAAAFLLIDATMKLLALPVVIKASAELGLGGLLESADELRDSDQLLVKARYRF